MKIIEVLLSINPNYILAGLIGTYFILEIIFNRPAQIGGKIIHFFHNFIFQLIVIAASGLLILITVKTFEWTNTHNFGLFNWIKVPFWVQLVVGLLMLDFSDYWMHKLDHKVPVFWRFHRVHHSDTSMDSSTALRQFPTEAFYFLIGELFFAVLLGLDIIVINVFVFLLLPVFFFQHASLNYPVWIDKKFGLVFVTPNFHKIHHEQDVYYTDSNYGTLLIIWDRLFGTFKLKPIEDIKFGLIEFEGNKKQSFLYQIRSPFITMNPKTPKGQGT